MVIGIAAAATQAETTELDCIIEPDMVIELSSPVDGIVENVAVDKSDRVSAGQLLATLESRMERTVVDLASARAERDEEVLAARVQRDLSWRKRDRIQELFEKKSAPQFEKDEAEAEARLAELELIRAKNDKNLAQLELERAKADVSLRSITSPIDGVVVERFANPGESVNDRPLLKLAKIDPMRVEIIAPGHLFGRIQPGSAAEVVTETPADKRYSGEVNIVDSIVDAASGTFSVRLKLPNPDSSVVGGVRCRATLALSD